MKTAILKNTPAVFLIFSILTLSVISCNETSESGFFNSSTSLSRLKPQAKQIVRDGLYDPDPAVRTNAIEVAGTCRVIEFMQRVEQMLQDEFVPVRFSAALAIGDCKYTQAKNSLNTLLRLMDENTRIAAAYALYRLGDDEKISIIAQAITSKDTIVRANSAFLLGKAGDKSTLKLLYWAMDDPDSDEKVRFQAAEAIARLGDEKIYPKLWTLILNVNTDDRILGVYSMGALGTKQAQGALTTQLADPVVEVRLVAAEQLGRLGNTTGQPEVLDVFTNNLNEEQIDDARMERIYHLAALAIGEIKTPTLVEYLPKLLKNKSKFVSLAAAKAVLQCQTEQD